MNSYASMVVVPKNFPTPLTTKKIKAAVKKVVDKDDWSKKYIPLPGRKMKDFRRKWSPFMIIVKLLYRGTV